MLEYSWFIFLPYLVAILLIALYNKRNSPLGGYLGLGASVISFIASLHYLNVENPLEQIFLTVAFGDNDLRLGIVIDQLSLMMVLLITFIGILVFAYSIAYMAKDRSQPRFYAELCFFAVAMIGLVMSNGFTFMFICWELVGIASYLLVAFWHHKPKVPSAAHKVIMITLTGDAMFFAGIVILYVIFHSLNFEVLNELAIQDKGIELTIAMALILGGVWAKSAQAPFHIWLPTAMAGPIPVSTYLHAATMVKAGIFLVARAYPLFKSSGLLPIIFFMGAITAFIGTSSAFTSTHIKKVTAYSTVGQLGVMLMALGGGAYAAGLFHLVNQTFFKALLFMCAGVIIHLSGTHDLREVYANERITVLEDGTCEIRRIYDIKKNKLLTAAIVIGSLGLAGFPPFNGFWSKEEILAGLAGTNPVFYLFIVGTFFLTSFYIFRWLFLIMSEKEEEIIRFKDVSEAHEFEALIMKEDYLVKKERVSWFMLFPIVILAFLVITFGFTMRSFNLWMGLGSAVPQLSIPYMVVSAMIDLTAIFVTYMIYYKKRYSIPSSNRIVSAIQSILVTDYGLNSVAEKIADAVLGLSRAIFSFDFKMVDGIINGLGLDGLVISRGVYTFDSRIVDGIVNGIGDTLKEIGRRLRNVESGVIETYATYAIVGLLLAAIILVLLR